jgi:hypothetical protein
MTKLKGTRAKTIEKTSKYLTILHSQCKDKFVPQTEAFSIKQWNDKKMQYELIPLSVYCNRDTFLNKSLLIEFGIIEMKKIKERNHVRWVAGEPTDEFVREICERVNVLKNYGGEVKTEEPVVELLEIKETEVAETPKEDIKTVTLVSEEININTLAELIAAQRVESNKALEYSKILAEQTSKFTEAVKELTAVLRKK